MTKQAVDESIAICKPGVPYREIGNKIEAVIKPKGYGIVRRYTGHGIHELVSYVNLRCVRKQLTRYHSSTVIQI